MHAGGPWARTFAEDLNRRIMRNKERIVGLGHGSPLHFPDHSSVSYTAKISSPSRDTMSARSLSVSHLRFSQISGAITTFSW